MDATAQDRSHYQRPGLLTRRAVNPLVMAITRLGISLRGGRVLEVRGRSSGVVRQVPVNLLGHDGHEFLVAPRGETEWVRNVRAAGGHLDLVVGRRRHHYVAIELADAAKPPVLRAYLTRWQAETRVFFGGVGSDATDEQLRGLAPAHPVFEIRPA